LRVADGAGMVDFGSRVEFVLNAEEGILERQAVMLCESIRQFAGALSSSAITVVSPRKSRRPSPAALSAIDRLGAEFLPLDVDSVCPEYGPSFKVHAVSHAARRPGPPIVVQVDSDSLFVAEPTSLLGIEAAAARPVDLKGMCTAGPGDAFDAYWRAACTLFGVDYEGIPTVRTTVDRQLVRASYNGGLFAARRDVAIFERTEEFFRKLAVAGLTPWNERRVTIRTGSGMVSELGSSFWGTSQLALSLAAVAGGIRVDLLPETYNLPLHCLDDMVAEVPTPLVHLHYHWLASSGTAEANALLDTRLHLATDVREWLRARLPLRASS
jgi:hypothetical protein